jgi:hypothetical protein
MSTVSAASDLGIAGSERGHGKTRGRTVQALGFVLLAVAIVVSVGVGLRGTADSEASSRSRFTATVAGTTGAVMPAAPTDGVLTMVIPPGAAADQRAGGRGYQIPDVIQLTAGDRIVLRNDDRVPHMILYAFLMPGQTHERTLMTPGLGGVQLRLRGARRVLHELHDHLRQRVGAVTKKRCEAGRRKRLVESTTTDRDDGQLLS